MAPDTVEQSCPLLRCRRRDGLEVLGEANVGVAALFAMVEVQERPRSEVEGRVNLALVTQAVDLAKRGDQRLVRLDWTACRGSHGETVATCRDQKPLATRRSALPVVGRTTAPALSTAQDAPIALPAR